MVRKFDTARMKSGWQLLPIQTTPEGSPAGLYGAFLLTKSTILLFGGINYSGKTTKSHLFSTKTNEFTPAPSLLKADQFYHSMCFPIKNQVAVCGIEGLHVFDKSEMEWVSFEKEKGEKYTK